MTDLSKRNTMKNVALATASVGSGLFGTLAFAKTAEEQTHPGLKLKVEQGEDGTLKVSLLNDSKHTIKLNDLSPSQISTPSGDIDMGHLVANKGFSLGPQSQLELLTSYTENKHNSSHLLLNTSKNIISRNLKVSTSLHAPMTAIPMLA